MPDPSSMWLPLGFHEWMPVAQALTLGLLTFVQEDVPTVSAALLAAAGSLTWKVGFLGCFLGIWIGDALLYGHVETVARLDERRLLARERVTFRSILDVLGVSVEMLLRFAHGLSES